MLTVSRYLSDDDDMRVMNLQPLSFIDAQLVGTAGPPIELNHTNTTCSKVMYAWKS